MQTLKQIGWSIWLTVCFLAVFSAGWVSHYFVDQAAEIRYFNAWCPDVPHRSSWIAYSKENNRYKCFQEWHQYPRNAKGYLIPDDAKDHYPTPINFLQKQLRFDLREEERVPY